mgnify:CR=1 FL=1
MSALVSIRNLTRVFDVSRPWLNRIIERLPKRLLTAVSDVSFDIPERTTYALVGESGSTSVVVDRVNTTIGIRDLRYTGSGFELNTQHVHVRGFCDHNEWVSMGVHVLSLASRPNSLFFSVQALAGWAWPCPIASASSAPRLRAPWAAMGGAPPTTPPRRAY